MTEPLDEIAFLARSTHRVGRRDALAPYFADERNEMALEYRQTGATVR